jgi:SOS-response transcriptional repressor LexA
MELLLDRIDARLISLSLTDNDASAQTGKDRSLIRDLRRRAAENKPLRVRMDTLEALADALQTSVDYLVGKVDDPSSGRARIRPIPILNAFTLLIEPHERSGGYCVYPTIPVGPDAFAYMVLYDDMIEDIITRQSRSLFVGDMVIIDPDLEAKPGDLVLAVLDGRVVIRRYQERVHAGGLVFVRLAAVNPDYPSFELEETDYRAFRRGVLVEQRRAITDQRRIIAP